MSLAVVELEDLSFRRSRLGETRKGCRDCMSVVAPHGVEAGARDGCSG